MPAGKQEQSLPPFTVGEPLRGSTLESLIWSSPLTVGEPLEDFEPLAEWDPILSSVLLTVGEPLVGIRMSSISKSSSKEHINADAFWLSM